MLPERCRDRLVDAVNFTVLRCECCGMRKPSIRCQPKWYKNQCWDFRVQHFRPDASLRTGRLSPDYRPTGIRLWRTVCALIALIALLILLGACKSLASLHSSIKGAGNQPVSAPVFTPTPDPPLDRIRIARLGITAPAEGAVLLKGTSSYGLTTYFATYAFAEDTHIGFRDALATVFEIDSTAPGTADLSAQIRIDGHTEKGILCKSSWETVTTVDITIVTRNVDGAPQTKSYSSSVEESLCAIGIDLVRLFPRPESVAAIVQKAFDTTIAKVLADYS